MTVEQKLEALYNAVNKAWDDAFDGWEWDEPDGKNKPYILGERHPENGFAFFVAVNDNYCGGYIWIEYDPKKDIVGIFIKDSPIHAKFTEDLKNLFEKYAPFDMTVSYERKTTPILSRKAMVEPKDFLKFFKDFRTAYKENYPLFYMFTVSAKDLYEGSCVVSGDC